MGTNAAVEMLERRKKELESTSVGRELAELNTAIAALTGGDAILVVDRHGPRPNDYEGLGILVAAKRWLQEVGGNKTTPEIVEGLKERGWTTKSNNPVATVYSTLANAKEFRRQGAGRDGRWSLKEQRR
jgi:hypothetical protein